jgi:hypothetical protein
VIIKPEALEVCLIPPCEASDQRAAAAKRPKPTAPSAKHSGSNQTH